MTKVDSVAEWLDSLDRYNQPTCPGGEEEMGDIHKWEVLELVRIARQHKAFIEQPED